MNINLINNLLNLQKVIDDESGALFAEFCMTALNSPDPNGFIKKSLRKAIADGPEPEVMPGPPVQEVRKTSSRSRIIRRK